MISVIIPTYNSAPYIKQAIDSVLSQTLLPDEIIVVDDGSTDNTVEIITSYIQSKKIVYIKKENGGPASARNLGIKKSKGDFIAFLDADDIWLPEKLVKQVTLFNDPAVGLVYSRRIFVPNHELDKGLLYSGSVTSYLIRNNFITNSSVMIRREICGQVGNFQEKERFIAIEDYDFWLKASALCQFAYVDDGLVYYRIHENQISTTRYFVTVRNIIKLYFGMFFMSRYKNFKILIFLKMMYGIKDYLFAKIKLCYKR